MLYGIIKPTVIKIYNYRFRYRVRGLPYMKPLRVIGWDMKQLLVADERVVKVYKVLWEDIHLVESEQVVQASVINKVEVSKSKNIKRERNSLFKSST